MIYLSEMAARLARDVPAQDGFPSPTQYEEVVQDAVHAFNDRYGVKKAHTFTTVIHQAEYTMPADFSRLIQLERFSAVGDVAVTADGLIPLSLDINQEQALVNGRTLTLYPTPAYALTRRVWYHAIHALDENDAYPDMLDDVASLVHIKAQANAWRLVCGKVSRSQAWKYQQGDVMIDKTKVGDALKGWVADLDTEFDQRMTRRIGTVGGLRGC